MTATHQEPRRMRERRARQERPRRRGGDSSARSRLVAAAPYAAIAALALTLGLFRLTQKSMWYDEAYSVAAAHLGWGDLFRLASRREGSHGLYYGVLKVWELAGDSEAVTRMLSVAAGTLAALSLVELGTRLFDRRVGLLAGGLLAVHPLVVSWMQQVRGYTLATLTAIIATTALVRALERRSWAAWSIYVAAAAVAAYAHLYGGLVIVAHGLAILLARRDAVDRRLVAAFASLGVAAVPALWFVGNGDVGQVSWIPPIQARWLAHVASQVAGGNVAALFAFGAATVLGLAAARRYTRANVALVVAWVAVPPVAAVAVSLAYKPLLYPRYLIVSVPALALLAALGLARLRGPALAAALVVVAAPLAFQLERWYTAPSREDWRQAVAIVDARSRAGEGIRVSVLQALLGYRYYAGERRATLDELLREQFSRIIVPRRRPTDTVWLLVHTDSVGWQRAGEPLRALGLTLRRTFVLQDVQVQAWQ